VLPTTAAPPGTTDDSGTAQTAAPTTTPRPGVDCREAK
jgi:hypothetical protein